MSHTSIETLAAAAYERLNATRLERAIGLARQINPAAKASRYDACVSPCFALLELTDHLDANREAGAEWDAICDRRTKQNHDAIADAKLDAARKAQPQAWAA